ncbi:MAG TPA: sigma-70 family RNA polymerase sigma factor [Blastocatellia bacterium]|nr:sigma-70 family RNA polymerase sigma factor [Blastocatellia bacterium]
MTEESLNRLLACFHSDRDIAGHKLELLRQKLITFFESHRCHLPEEYADRTIYRVARKLDEGLEISTEDPSRYFLAVAGNILMEYWEEKKKYPISLDDLPHWNDPFSDPTEREIEEMEKILIEQKEEYLSKCLQELSDEERELITEYYQGEAAAKVKNRKELAEQRGMPLNALRIRVFRIRKKLEDCIGKRFGK